MAALTAERWRKGTHVLTNDHDVEVEAFPDALAVPLVREVGKANVPGQLPADDIGSLGCRDQLKRRLVNGEHLGLRAGGSVGVWETINVSKLSRASADGRLGCRPGVNPGSEGSVGDSAAVSYCFSRFSSDVVRVDSAHSLAEAVTEDLIEITSQLA